MQIIMYLKTPTRCLGWQMLAGLMLLVGCQGKGAAPDVSASGGQSGSAGHGGGASDPCPKTTVEMQNQLLGPGCGQDSCHGLNDPAAGLDLVSPHLEQRLINAPALGCFPDLILVAGKPEQSLLFTKVALATQECGVRMPVAGRLLDEEIECMRQWIVTMTAAPPDGGVVTMPDAGNPSAVCAVGQSNCSGSCVNIQSDNRHCGGCGRLCSGGTSCVDGKCICSGASQLCGATCADTQTNNTHCGMCNKACGVNQLCTAGKCICLPGLTDCGSSCSDTTSDAKNCGMCGRACGNGEVCSNSQCQNGACPRDTKNCGGSCVNVSTNALACGDCGISCGAGQTCQAGQCGCEGTNTLCSGVCANTASDTNNCGDCGKVCAAGSLCVNGSCGCGSNLTVCNGSCIDVSSDPSNCGECAKACAAGESCSNGQCSTMCPSGLKECGGACVNINDDEKNCGTCGKICATGEACKSGQCVGCGPAVSFNTQLQPILTASCTAGCHGGTRPSAGLDLTTGQAYAAMVNVAASGCRDGRLRVSPGNVAGSYLIAKLLGTNMCSGNQMPAREVSLPAEQIELFRAWICQGAAKN